jgi:beta-galactosidase
VPFEPGRLVAVARRSGSVVALDELETAGDPDAVRLTPDKRVFAADGKALSFVTVEVVDDRGVVVSGADNPISFEVTGGRLVGLDNGQEESAENYKASSRRAFNGKALAIVQSGESAGPMTVRATSPGLLPASATVFASDERGSRLIGLEPVWMRTEVGEEPELPSTVRGVFADGSTRAFRVRWDQVPDEVGIHSVEGDAIGTSIDARATVSVYSLEQVEAFSTVVPVGVAPWLPGRVRLEYSDGVDRQAPVTWDAIDPARYASPGEFVVEGRVDGVARRARATVRVAEAATPDQNLSRSTSPTEPAADASFSGAPATVPAAMLDGLTTMGGWSSFYNRAATALLPAVSSARASEWVSVSWPEPQAFGRVNAYFTTDASRARPASIEVTYWNGTAFVPVRNLEIDWASASNEPTTITFDRVASPEIRMEMTSPAPGTASGFLQIAELEVIGDLVR